MSSIEQIKKELQNQSTVPYLGLGIFYDSYTATGERVPFDSDSLILAMNNGRPMTPRLMFEYSRAAMHLEQRRGVAYVMQRVNSIYSHPFSPTALQKALLDFMPHYIIDTNRDTKLQELLAFTPHILISGRARVLGDGARYEIFEWDREAHRYCQIDEASLKSGQMILFKPMGSPLPHPQFIISDADYVDWLTEAMAGFALPTALKSYRKAKKYLFLGTHFDRDTDRMVAHELTMDLEGGYVISDEVPTKKSQKFMQRHNLELIPMSLAQFSQAFI